MIGRASAALVAALMLVAAAPTPDRPEPGRQGESMPADSQSGILPVPYSKGVDLIGHDAIGKRAGNLIMAWSGRCAYVAGGVNFKDGLPSAQTATGPTSGVAVIDVRDPKAPKTVRYLQDKGALEAGETMHAVSAPGRAVLAASTYAGVSGMGPAKDGWLDIYDVSDCANPKLMAEVKWPEPSHTVTVSPNGRRVYGTIISPFTGNGGIQVMDISDMAHPRFVGKFAAMRLDGTRFEFAAHEISISPDEKRIYAGVIASKGNDLNAGIKIMPPNAEGLGPNAGGIYILDNSDIVAGRADPKMRLIGTSLHGGWHSVVQARIGGVPYLVGAGELGACPGSWPKITNIAHEKNPRIVGEFKLAMNLKENCPPREGIEIVTGGVIGKPGTASTHFNDVDSATNTRLGLFPFMYAGLRIADLRDPANPTEVAYFKPGDICGSHVRYVPATHQIWFACNASGFYVISVKPAVRAALAVKGR